MAGSDEMLFDISDVERDVLPDETWESEIRTVEATERPDFTNELGYTVLPRASRATEGILSIDSRTFDVVEASVSKTYDTDTLRSYREQKVESTITVTNTGSATINMIRMTDDIPGMFRAPRADEIVVRVNGGFRSHGPMQDRDRGRRHPRTRAQGRGRTRTYALTEGRDGREAEPEAREDHDDHIRADST